MALGLVNAERRQFATHLDLKIGKRLDGGFQRIELATPGLRIDRLL